MSAYLDARVLVSLFLLDALSDRATELLRANTEPLLVSDYAGAEFASAVARRVRIGERTAREARAAFANFDTWAARFATRVDSESTDVAAATAYLRRLDLTSRAPDALNIAIAERLGASLATFDDKMATSARALGVAVVSA